MTKRTILFATSISCLCIAFVTACKENSVTQTSEMKTFTVNKTRKDEATSRETKEKGAPDVLPIAKKTEEESNTIVSKEILYKSGKTSLKGFLAYDKEIKTKRPGVLVVHEWWGHNDYARKRTKMLAKLGYVAFALDMYGEGKKTTHPKDANKFMNEVLKNVKVAEERFVAAQKILETHSMVEANKIAAIGYCFGGGVVLHMARKGLPLSGVVSFHGTLKPMIRVKRGRVKAEILAFNGSDDPMIPEKDIQAFKREMKQANAKHRMVVFKGVKHAFTNPKATEYGKTFKLPLAYDKEADETSWQEMKVFFEKIFPKK